MIPQANSYLNSFNFGLRNCRFIWMHPVVNRVAELHKKVDALEIAKKTKTKRKRAIKKTERGPNQPSKTNSSGVSSMFRFRSEATRPHELGCGGAARSLTPMRAYGVLLAARSPRRQHQTARVQHASARACTHLHDVCGRACTCNRDVCACACTCMMCARARALP